MPALTFLSDDVVRAGRSVKDDKECDQILQDLRNLTGEDFEQTQTQGGGSIDFYRYDLGRSVSLSLSSRF